MRVAANRVTVPLSAAALVLAAWGVFGPAATEPATPSSGASQATEGVGSPVSEPHYTRAGIERARHEIGKVQRLDEELRQRDGL